MILAAESFCQPHCTTGDAIALVGSILAVCAVIIVWLILLEK